MTHMTQIVSSPVIPREKKSFESGEPCKTSSIILSFVLAALHRLFMYDGKRVYVTNKAYDALFPSLISLLVIPIFFFFYFSSYSNLGGC